jgi:5'-nucleotidase
MSVAPNAGRIKSVEVQENGAWAPIDEAKLYTVATNNFTRGGGDGYKLFAENAENAYDYGPGLEQVVADYLAANRPYTPKLDGRITAIEVAAAAPAEPASTTAEAPAAAEPAVPAPPAASTDIAATPPAVETAAAPAATEAAAPSAAAEGSHTIVEGDTLWDIAEKAYGDGAKWRAIRNANAGVVPRRLLVGTTLVIPPAS